MFSVEIGIDLGATRPEGHFQMIDHGTGTRVRSTSIDVYEWSGSNSRHIEGTCLINGASCPFALDLADNGEPGTGRDVFQLMVAGVTYGPAMLSGGNVQIDTCCR